MVDQDNIEGVSVRHWHALLDGELQCNIRLRECKLLDGQRGLYFLRAQRDSATARQRDSATARSYS